MIDIRSLLRPNIREFTPYSSARHEYSGTAIAWLDANENPYDTTLNRYPDPLQARLKDAIADIKQVDRDIVFVGHGSDEAIDLIIRAFCRPGHDKVMILPPTYGMYEVCAQIHDVGITTVPLSPDFTLDELAILDHLARTPHKVLFICSPNNPTGNLMDVNVIMRIAKVFNGLVVVDEAYIDFVPDKERFTMIKWLREIPNLVVLHTFSKAWGLAGARLGIAMAHPQVISVLNSIKPPYNISSLTQAAVCRALDDTSQVERNVETIITQRRWLTDRLRGVPCVEKIYPSVTNFLLVHVDGARLVQDVLTSAGIIVRDRTNDVQGCLRITVGTAEENQLLVSTMRNI